MEQNFEITTSDASEAAEAAPVRKRASRRVTAAAGAAGDVTVTSVEAPAAGAAETSEAPEAPAAAPKRATRSRKKAEPAADGQADNAAPETASSEPASAETAPVKTTRAAKAKAAAAADASDAGDAAEAPKKRATRSRKASAPENAEATSATAAEGADAAAEEIVAPKRATRSRKKAEPVADETVAAAGDAAVADTSETKIEDTAPEAKTSRSRRASSKAAESKAAESKADAKAGAADSENKNTDSGADSSSADQAAAETDSAPSGRRTRRRSNSNGTDQTDGEQASNEQSDAKAEDGKSRDRGGRQESAKADGDRSDNGRGDSSKSDSSSRSSRTRQRDRKRRGGDEHELEIAEDDVLLPIAGILDVLDNYAFVRTSGYLPGVSDVYVALGQVKKYGLRRGDAVVGAIRQPREGDGGGRQKYNAIVKIDSVNGKPVEETEKRPDIAEMTPVFPQQRVPLGTGSALGRAIEAIAPIGLGQRGLIVLPPQFSGAEVVRDLAADIAASTPDAHLMVVLTDAQPEVATELARSITGEVVAATFDRLPEDQTTISELGIDRARRLVELGHDVVVLVDSLNRLARGYAQSQQPAARPALGAIDEHAVFQIKRLLAAARNVENGGSLTLLATANAAVGSDADALLLRELKPIVNSVIEFDAASQIEAPTLDARESRTQNLQAMLDAKEVAAVAANRSKALVAANRSAK